MKDLGLSEDDSDKEASAAVWLLVFLFDSTILDLPSSGSGKKVELLSILQNS
jgi:hypothetical protein